MIIFATIFVFGAALSSVVLISTNRAARVQDGRATARALERR